MASALVGIGVVLSCAGPFRHAAGPPADAYIESGVHYLDIASEIPVYQALQAKDAEAKASGITERVSNAQV
jgi:short subunit dehydrogenase-like uncharacterized protein